MEDLEIIMKKVVILFAFAAVSLLPQAPGPGPGQPSQPQQAPVAEIKAYLSLSDAQVTQLQQLARTEADANRTRRQEIATKQQTLRDQLRAGSTDAATLGRLLLDAENIRRQIENAEKAYREQAVALLNAAQKTKLKALEDAMALHDEIRQGMALNLLTPPEAPQGRGGFGPRSRGGTPRGSFPPAE